MYRIPTTPIRADINVTPLVDVVLVLLIIFMVVTPYIVHGVELPSTANPALRPDRPKKVLITIARDHTVFVDGGKIAPEELAQRLKKSYAEAPESEVVVKADSHLSYGDVKRALLDVRDAGFGRAGLIATPHS